MNQDTPQTRARRTEPLQPGSSADDLCDRVNELLEIVRWQEDMIEWLASRSASCRDASFV